MDIERMYYICTEIWIDPCSQNLGEKKDLMKVQKICSSI